MAKDNRRAMDTALNRWADEMNGEPVIDALIREAESHARVLREAKQFEEFADVHRKRFEEMKARALEEANVDKPD